MKLFKIVLILSVIFISGCVSQEQTKKEKFSLTEDCMVTIAGVIFRNDTAISIAPWECRRPIDFNYSRGYGNYSIVFLDKDGKILDEIKSSIDWYRGGTQVNKAIFIEEVPAKRGTSEILIKHFDKVLLREPVSIHNP